jgi:hypothetical protein
MVCRWVCADVCRWKFGATVLGTQQNATAVRDDQGSD